MSPTLYTRNSYNSEAITNFDQLLTDQPDNAQSWRNRGIAISELGDYENAIISLEKSFQLTNDEPDFLWNCGLAFSKVACYEDAITKYDQALRLNPDFAEAWSARGAALNNLGRFQEALESAEKAIVLQPELAYGWHVKGFALRSLGRHEDAVASHDRALQLNPHASYTWLDRGLAIYNLGRYQEAIAKTGSEFGVKISLSDSSSHYSSHYADAIVSYDQALHYKPQSFETLYSRGMALADSRRYEDAIASYDQALNLKPDDPVIRHDRGIALANLGRYEEAIADYDQALALKPDFPDIWIDRGFAVFYASSFSGDEGSNHPTLISQNLQNPNLNLRGYEGCLACIQEGLKHAPEGSTVRGRLYQWWGEAHRLWGNRQESPRPYWQKAIACYEQALNIFTAATFPQARLEVLALLIRTHRAVQTNKEIVAALLRQGTGLLRGLLTEATSAAQKQRLGLQIASFEQATVDVLVQQGDLIKALETAEKDKNWLMTWLLRWQDLDDIPTASYDTMRQLLCPHTAIVYWHLSPDALTTFILRWDHPQPMVISRAQDGTQAGIQQVKALETWLQTWNQTYQAHIDKSKDTRLSEKSDWYNTLPDQLDRLASILQIDAIKTQLPSDLTHLTLIPHRDLHRLPLHYCFSEQPTTTLPSLQLGQTLRTSDPKPSQAPTALTITAPIHQGYAALYHAEAETHLINHLLAKTHTVETIAAREATHPKVSQHLSQPHQIFHFNGHAAYDFTRPQCSALALTDTDVLTVQDLLQISLETYSLVTLASCETALSGHQTITTEYVGITSAFLGQGIPHILSTLWTVESAASMVFMVEFYSHLHLGFVAAYHHSCQTLYRLTVAQLKTRYDQWLMLDLSATVREFLTEERSDLDTMDPDVCRYSHPYYWAALMFTGLGD